MPNRNLRKTASGVLLMSVLTLLWTTITEYAMRGEDYWIPLVCVVLLLGIFAFSFSRLSARAAGQVDSPLSEEELKEEKRQGKWFNMIGILEGVAIFLTANILINLHHSEYFISCIALIVGIHFFPLALVFKRPFHYYIGTWISLVAVIGLYLTYKHDLTQNHVTALVGLCCVASTSICAYRILLQGSKDLSAQGR